MALVQIILLVLNLTSPSEAVSELLYCEVEPLEAHGFVQMGDYPEYVCVNPADYTDFVVVADTDDSISEGNRLILGLNEYSEVIEQVNVSREITAK